MSERGLSRAHREMRQIATARAAVANLQALEGVLDGVEQVVITAPLDRCAVVRFAAGRKTAASAVTVTLVRRENSITAGAESRRGR